MNAARDGKFYGAGLWGLAWGLIWFAAVLPVSAQLFTNINTGLRGVFQSSSVAGDFDADGRMDLLIQGENDDSIYTTVWRNLGNVTFLDSAELTSLPGFTGSALGAVAVGDFYNVNRLDAIETGYNGSIVGELWHNLGNGNFNRITNSGLLPSEYGGIGVGDFNNDGLLDLVITGISNAPNVRVFLNLGQGIFTNTLGIANGVGAIFVGDFDNDGYLDILYGGVLFKNLGNGTFTNIPSGLPASPTAIGDVDNDGYLDALVGGQVWRNLGNGTFARFGMQTITNGQMLADYDDDGYLDILANGVVGNALKAQVWRNQHDGTFTNVASVAGSSFGSVTWADFNQDGMLDFLVTGYDGQDQNLNDIYGCQVWLNTLRISNAPPTAPTNLTAQIKGHSGVKLSWGAATDDHTPASGLNYNIRVGSSPGGVDIVSPEADVVTGRRLVVDIGNAQERLFSLLTNLSGGTYYWSVQAIDTAFAGGAFAAESSFVIPPSVGTFGLGSNGVFLVGFNGLANNSYSLQGSTDLAGWTNLVSVVAGSNGVVELVDTNAGSFGRRFYRLRTP